MQKETWNEIVNLKIVNLKILPNFSANRGPQQSITDPPLSTGFNLEEGKNHRKLVRTAGSLLVPQ